jgi:hypothetical protein
MFFFKRSKIVVDCFTTRPAINDLFPIEKSSKFYPQWWKDLPKTYDRKNDWGLSIQLATLKGCVGFTNLYTHGFMIPLWADLLIETTEDRWLYEFSAASKVESHDEEQLGSMGKVYHHMKLVSPWIISEKSGVNFIWTNAFYNQIDRLNDYHILPGMIEYKYNFGSNINLFLPKTNNRMLLEAGTPMVHFIPMTDKDVEVKTHVVSEEEYRKLETPLYTSKFIKKYYTNKKIMQSKEGKCPFGKS